MKETVKNDSAVQENMEVKLSFTGEYLSDLLFVLFFFFSLNKQN